MAELKTIPLVEVTPRCDVVVRGRQMRAKQPRVGSLVLMKDNGFASGIGSRYPYVVTAVHTVKKTGVVTGATLNSVVSVDREAGTVTYDAHRSGSISLYTNAGWADHPSHNLYYYEWDAYEPVNHGDCK